jgi:hypothetical protein
MLPLLYLSLQNTSRINIHNCIIISVKSIFLLDSKHYVWCNTAHLLEIIFLGVDISFELWSKTVVKKKYGSLFTLRFQTHRFKVSEQHLLFFYQHRIGWTIGLVFFFFNLVRIWGLRRDTGHAHYRDSHLTRPWS